MTNVVAYDIRMWLTELRKYCKWAFYVILVSPSMYRCIMDGHKTSITWQYLGKKPTRHFNVDSNEKIDRFFYIEGKLFRTSVYMMKLNMT